MILMRALCNSCSDFHMEETATCRDRYHKSSLAEFTTRRSKFAKSLTLTPVISYFKVTIKQSFKMTSPLAWTVFRRLVSSI